MQQNNHNFFHRPALFGQLAILEGINSCFVFFFSSNLVNLNKFDFSDISHLNLAVYTAMASLCTVHSFLKFFQPENRILESAEQTSRISFVGLVIIGAGGFASGHLKDFSSLMVFLGFNWILNGLIFENIENHRPHLL